MNTGKKITPHETFDLHELLVLKTVTATKLSAMTKLVNDEALKTIMQQDFTYAQQHIKELQNLLQSSVLAPSHIRNATSRNETVTKH
ncbi:hypothetical protein [Clostridium formicaceticum]|uniref:Spore coat protein n=1 Tax=Clostridium formicaceticum TaxID=1497 RepID=A0AAC9WI84_9CLOT|nr:hypothetical protein [Clostridium formicaceticum]AOY77912.1 hypothetical protein BJL90_19830 [Clostridium formicaceticum]ARE88530.1 hypothetical protein CLFO_29360 [Clostridium formicaceticum]